ncbi:hypothetical protein L7F22_035350 [Adiantum nelumboides]|nr:hypothetical protein [Adiantum nelumboides]
MHYISFPDCLSVLQSITEQVEVSSCLATQLFGVVMCYIYPHHNAGRWEVLRYWQGLLDLCVLLLYSLYGFYLLGANNLFSLSFCKSYKHLQQRPLAPRSSSRLGSLTHGRGCSKLDSRGSTGSLVAKMEAKATERVSNVEKSRLSIVVSYNFFL